MNIKENFSLKNFNTFGIDVKARFFVELKNTEEIIHFVRRKMWDDQRLLILDGGSNILFTNDFDGYVIKLASRGIVKTGETESHVLVQANAGENWHEFVTWCINNEYGGLENLSLIPGNVGAAPIQNIGAYGVEQKDVFESLEAISIRTGEIAVFNKDDCRFEYRDSIFKRELKDEYIILSVSYKLLKSPEFNLGYGELKRIFDGKALREITLRQVSDAVCSIRNAKLPDPSKLGNAGSFFKNPVVSKKAYFDLLKKYPGLPGYPTNSGDYKIAAGWMIDQLGWKGYRDGDAGVCETQALVLVNWGAARGDEILAVASKIQQSVKKEFNISLEPEVNII